MTRDQLLPKDVSTMRTRASLIFRLRDWKDDKTWREFWDIYYNYVYRHARGSGLCHHEAEDVTQEVFERVACNIDKFEPQPQAGSFRRWLGNQVRWKITDRLRKKQKHPIADLHDPESDRTDVIERISSQESEALRMEQDWKQQLYETAMQRLAKAVNPKHYQVFVLHHKEEWSLKRIAKELGISTASAYVINHRLKGMLNKDLKMLSVELE